MAYVNYIAAVPLDQIAELRRNRNSVLRPSRLEMVSHLLAYWVKAQPAGKLFEDALDGGEFLADGLEHPYRPPMMHLPADVFRLRALIRVGLEAAAAAADTNGVEGFRLDIDRLLRVMDVAIERGEAIISVLEPPMDEERASKVRIPFAIGAA